MFKKTVFWIALGSTAFILFIFAGLYGMVFSPSQNSTDGVQISQETIDILAQREADYQLLIDQANQQLATAQAIIDGQSAPAAVEEQGAQYQVSADLASQIAQSSVSSGAQPNGQPQLVDFEGNVAYEVPFDAGMIYVDANSAQVLFNGTVNLTPAKVTAEQAAQIAASYMGNNSIYLVDATTLSGINVFRVKFTNSDAVFVDEYGQIVLVRLASPAPSAQTASNEQSEHEHDDD